MSTATSRKTRKSKRTRARAGLEKYDTLGPVARPANTTTGDPVTEDGQGRNASQFSNAPSVADACHTLRQLQCMRVATINAQRRINNSTRALVRQFLGFNTDADANERERLCKEAEAFVSAVEAGEVVAPEMVDLSVYVLAAQTSRTHYDVNRKTIEQRMSALAETLPAWAWVEQVKGCAALGLAKIVGEAGDLSGYANPGKLWKRFGLAPYNGRLPSQWRKLKQLSGDEWTEIGYCPRRRSEAWNIGEALSKARGHYKHVFDERKLREVEKAGEDGLVVVTTNASTVASWAAKGLPAPMKIKAGEFDPEQHRTCGHVNSRAMVYMTKRFLRDLWRAWRGQVGGDAPLQVAEPCPAD